MAWQQVQNRRGPGGADVCMVGKPGSIAVTVRKQLAEEFGLTEGMRVNVFTDPEGRKLALVADENGQYTPTDQNARWRVSVSAAVRALGYQGVPVVSEAKITTQKGLGKALVIALGDVRGASAEAGAPA